MGKFIDLSGKIFGSWQVIQRVRIKKNITSWLCKCACGMEGIVNSSHLIGGYSTKCKTCHNAQAVKKRPVKHGHAIRKGFSKEYSTWCSMRTRCNNPNDEHWPNYGGRGIKIDPKWNDFNVFFNDMGNRPRGHTLDRIDNNGNYSKENCRWVTNKIQCANKRTNILFELNGVKKTKTQWAREYNIPYTSFSRMIKKIGWPLPPPKDISDGKE